MAVTDHLGITLVEQAQAQKEVTVNEALTKIDAVLNVAALDKDLATPPVSPSGGDAYIVAAPATDDWAGHEGELAYFNQVWRFIVPNEGMTLWVADEDLLYTYDGLGWVQSGGASSLPLFGVNTTADTTNRLSVNSDAVLLNHNGSDSQVKVNKNASGDTASHLFQTAFSGRAEFGLISEDHFSLKVSDDGSTFREAFKVDNASGNVAFKKMLGLGDPEDVEISGGEITVTQSYVRVETEGSASTDDLVTINGGSTGDILVLRAYHNDHDVVVKDNTGNLKLAGDFTMDGSSDRIMFIKEGSNWYALNQQSN